MQTFGDRLRQWAKAEFGGLDACAEAMGMNYNQLNKYLNGFSKPDLDRLEKFAKAGLNIHWALTGKGSMVWTEELSEAGALVDENRALRIGIADIARQASAVSAELNALLPSEEHAAQK